MRTDLPQTIYLKDYKEPAFKATHVDLTFRIFEDRTEVRTVSKVIKNGNHKELLILNGEHMRLKSLQVNENYVPYRKDDKSVTVPNLGDKFTLEIETIIEPAKNTALEGLYMSQGIYCTQCEAEGFRRITYYIDRPDNMATFTTRIEADKKTLPVLLSNGDLVEEGELPEGRHFTLWSDTTPKPCYLFALVAGDLKFIQDEFKTMSGTKVDLRIYVRDGDQEQCAHAMDSLKRSMKWDEETFGREYQYKRFNIVAVSDFNMGAMENTSLNIFNTALTLAHADTATDLDFGRVESVIAHEYFHNWTGNRITCRDWFQLSLKEGFTVFRDQEFSADMGSRAVQRIDDVAHLRRMQFPEDAGPMAHPIRPDNYIEINNFYTMTVYEKGAEIVRMQKTLLGPQKFREATDLYFNRFDGQAVTCDDFVQCMADVSGLDMKQFKLWYSQAGTPRVKAHGAYSADHKTYTLILEQSLPPTPGQKHKEHMHIPVAIGFIGPNGQDIPLENGETTEIIHLKQQRQEYVFKNIGAKPVTSILRNFSAPVILETDHTEEELRFLMTHDSDGFNKWEAGQNYMLRTVNHLLAGTDANEKTFLDTMESLFQQALEKNADHALLARSVVLPEVGIIGQQQAVIDPSAIYAARQKLRTAVAAHSAKTLEKIYDTLGGKASEGLSGKAMGARALRNVALSYLTADGSHTDKAVKQYKDARNMTERIGALTTLLDTNAPERDALFADFLTRFERYELVVDKWFSLQTQAVRETTLADIQALRSHKLFNIKNPNRARSLFSAFSMNNTVMFHHPSGAGYKFLGDAIMELNRINPQIASRLLTPLREWRRYTPDRQEKMKAILEQIKVSQDLSKDVFEVVSKSLAA
ncbi:MAG: aminopeptidase N [Alphaproteobacteria bacterium]|nr:aminopeptidase N [Alphaproteobacteria bacterium]